MRSFYSIILFLSFAFHCGYSQNFIADTDATGYDMQAYKPQLEEATNSLFELFLEGNYKDSLVVVEVGFYLHHKDYRGGLDAFFSQKEQEISLESPYYVLIGRVYQENGGIDFKVATRLPKAGIFDCMADRDRENLAASMRAKILSTLGASRFPNKIAAAEVAGINFLKEQLNYFLYCTCYNSLSRRSRSSSRSTCPSIHDFSTIDSWLLGLGFRKRSVEIGNNSSWNNNNDIYDYANKQIRVSGSLVTIPNQIIESKLAFDDFSQGKVFIVDNESFDNGEWDTYRNAAEDSSNDYVECWAIINAGEEYYLYSKYVLPKHADVASPSLRGPVSSSRSTPALAMKYVLKFLGNAGLDALFQAVIYRIIDEEVDDWTKAYHKISKWGALWEGVSSLIPWKQSRLTDLLRAATTAFIGVVDKTFNQDNYTFIEGMVDFSSGFVASYATQLVSHPKVRQLLGNKLNTIKILFSKGLVRWYRSTTFPVIKGIIKPMIKTILGNGGKLVKDYDQYASKELFEVFYRKIPQEHYEHLQNVFKLKATTETSTSPNIKFTTPYDGVLVKFLVKPGTIDEFKKIGKNADTGSTPMLVKVHFGEFSHGKRGWGKDFVRFKVESNKTHAPIPQVNIQLGVGKGMDIFNDNLLFFEKI